MKSKIRSEGKRRCLFFDRNENVSFMPKGNEKPKILCCNGDESEPGSFKDREIFEKNPQQFIEGSLIAAYAMGIGAIYVYIRGEYEWINIMEEAVAEYYKRYDRKNIMEQIFMEMYVHMGAGAISAERKLP
ncbi:MAG: hypothetical protein R2942_14350 [Ignavibacteria bacterium]